MKDKKNRQSTLFPRGFTAPHLLSGMKKNSSILVGFSGGADSRALLDLLIKYGNEVGARVFAAHVNHGSRGEEADRDEEFCRRVAESYGIPFFVHRVNIPSLARACGKSVELCARDERYAFFAKLMREHDIGLLATAHNANDNLETMLFNLARGSGLSGLCGIPEARETEGGMLIRPILLMSKDEVLSYCEDNSLSFVTDSTNTDTDYTRNKIRAEIVPVLKSIVPSPERKASHTSALLRQDEELLSEMTNELLGSSEGASIELSALLGAHRAISSRAIIKLFCRVCDTSLESVHVDDILELCRVAKNGSRISLPAGFCACIRGSRLEFVATSEIPEEQNVQFLLNAGKGEWQIPEINAEIFIGKYEREINIYKKSIKFDISSAKINGAFNLRERRAGDKIFMGGMHKSVKKLMCDKKIPTELRARIPMICVNDEIIAIPFIGVSDAYNPKKCAKNELAQTISIQFYLY